MTTDPQQLFYRMKIHQRIGETEKSVVDGLKLLEMIGESPKSSHLSVTKAGALTLLNRPHEAMKVLESISNTQDIETHLVYIERCRAYILMGNWENALEDAIRVKQSNYIKISAWITSANIEISRYFILLF